MPQVAVGITCTMHRAENTGMEWHLNCSDVDAVRPKLAIEAVHHDVVCYPRLHCHLRHKLKPLKHPRANAITRAS